MTGFMVAVALATLSAAGLVWLSVPRRANLAVAVARWDADRATATRAAARREEITESPWRRGRLGRRVTALADHVLAWWRAHTPEQRQRALAADLALLDSSLEAHVVRMLGLAIVGLLAPLALTSLFSLAQLALPWTIAVTAALGLAALMPWLVQRDLRDRASAKRAEFRRGLSIYLDLVAMSMEAGRGQAEALPAAADIGRGWVFTLLSDTVGGARYAGVTPWRALGVQGERLGIPELVDLEAALALAVDDGAHIRATLVARAETLRSRRIADAKASAATATESMRFALILMVFAFLTYELFPPVTRLFAG